MPAYNFQKQFVPMILDGTKPHTIRPERKYPTKVGDMLWLYTGMRTKQCKLIASAPCMDVQFIKIFPHLRSVVIDDSELTMESVDRLVRRDGFTSRDAFFEFFMRYSAEVREHYLRLIWWDRKKMIESDVFATKLEAIAEWEESRKVKR